MPPAPAAPRPRRREARAARRRAARERFDPGLAAEGIVGHLVVTAERVIAWYVVPLHRYSFLPPGDRMARLDAATARLAQLAGRRCYLRITDQPFPVRLWAQALDESIRGRHPVLPGPCPAHPHRSAPGCPSCVPGHAWLDWLAAQQRRVSAWGIADKQVYLGVEVAARTVAARLAARIWQRAADTELRALFRDLADIRRRHGPPPTWPSSQRTRIGRQSRSVRRWRSPAGGPPGR